MKTHSLIVFSLSMLALLASLATLFFVKINFALPFQLFYLSLLLLSICLLLEYKNIIAYFTRKYHYISPSSLLRISLGLVCLILIQSLIYKRQITYDLTEDQLYSVSQSTVALFSKKQPKIKIYASKNEHQFFYQSLERFFLSLKTQVKDLNLEYIDVLNNPSRAKDEGVLSIPGILLLDDQKSLFLKEEQVIFYKQGYESVFLGEGALQSAYIRLYNQSSLNLICPSELSLIDDSINGYRALASILSYSGFKLNTGLENYDPNAPLLLLINDHNEKQPELISLFENHQSQALLLIDSNKINQVSNIELSKEFVIDFQRSLREDAFIFAPLLNPDHKIGKSHPANQLIALAGAKALIANKQEDLKPILYSSATSLISTNINGPFTLMAEIKNKNKIILSDTDLATNQGLTIPGNQDLILNSLFYLTKQQELINSFAKPIKARILEVPKEERIQFLAFIVFILPGLALALSFIFYLYHQKHN